MKNKKYDLELVDTALRKAHIYSSPNAISNLKKVGYGKKDRYTWNEINDLCVRAGASIKDIFKIQNELDKLAKDWHWEDYIYEAEMLKKMKKIIESKQFDKLMRSKLKSLTECVVELPDGEQKVVSPEEIEQLNASGVEYKVIKDDINTEVDKETWGDETVEEPVNNDNMVTVDDEVEEDEEEDLVSFLTKKDEPEVKPNEPAVLSEFDDLSNEEKKALLLKLAKNDSDLNAILSDYLNRKVEEDCGSKKMN